MAPLQGLRVVELSLGVSAVGAGPAISLPGSLLRDFGAEVVRIQSAQRSTLDAGVQYERVWNRGKSVVEVDHDDATRVASTVGEHVSAADVLLLAGPEALIEQAGLHYRALAQANPRLVVVRVRPSFNSGGPMGDYELLVHARSGVPTQIRAHRPGPAFGDLAVGSVGAGLSAAIGALAALYERETTGVGAWAETSLYDGVQAMLPMISGRVEHHSPTTTLLWKNQGPAESLCYRCADGQYIQLWFGAKGAYEQFLEHIGDEPSVEGYNADMMSGALVERGKRWTEKFATQPLDWWVADLAGNNFRAEPAWRPGQALGDGHLREVGLSVELEQDGEQLTVLGPVVAVRPTGEHAGAVDERTAGSRTDTYGGPLSGVRVADLSAYLAGPVAPLILAELGADVVKVEPLTGDIHRNMEPMFAAGQRGKRAMAVDMKAPDAPAVLAKIFAWADVVHHNSRVGLAERLGYDEAAVRAANPNAVYSFASGFGEGGPKMLLPANDQLMQAITGIEAGQGGSGQSPTFLVWGAVDVTGGWIAATGILAALYARRREGHRGGQRVASSLLGAGMTLKSGAFIERSTAGERLVEGPVLDGNQTGYGAAYRLYQGSDGAWIALVVPDVATWQRLREVVSAPELPDSPPPLRTDHSGLQPEEIVLESVFASKAAATWLHMLRAAHVPVEPVDEADRTEYSSRYIDDPVNRELGRIVSYQWNDKGLTEQPKFPPRMGPRLLPGAGAFMSELGEHTTEMLETLGFDAAQRAALAASGTVPTQR